MVCRELGWGPPVEVAGYARDFLGSQIPGSPSSKFHDSSPLCAGNEPSLDFCDIQPRRTTTCRWPASVRCQRTKTEDSHMILDHLPVCAAGLDKNANSALCREEGFSHGVSSSGDVVGTCRLLVCSSANLLNCQMSIGVNQEAAVVECDADVGVQLLGGMQADRGHVIYLNGLLCDDDWNLNAANVVCRELGFSGAANLTTHSYFGPVETPLMISQGVAVPYSIKSVVCDGTEEKVSDCNITAAVDSDCQFGEAAGVICATEPSDGGRKRRKREAKKRIKRMSPAAALAALKMGADGAEAVAQGANAVAETAASLNSAKESLTQLFDRGPVADSGGDKMLASALSYFEKKQQQRDEEQQKMLSGSQSSVNLGPVGIEMKLKHEKGYLDLGKQNSQKVEKEKIICLKYACQIRSNH